MMVFLNGSVICVDDARLDFGDRGFTLGDGLFETIRVRAGRPTRLDAHLARLRAGAAILDLPVRSSDQALGDAMVAVLAANGLPEGVLRLTVTRGPAPRGLLPPATPMPTVLVTVGPLPPPGGPLTAVVAAGTRRNEHSPLSRCKCLNYLDNVLARQEAARRGADEAILLNTAGRLAETTIANLFLVVEGRVVTPPVTDGALPGVMRAEAIAATGALERSLDPGDLTRAEEVFATNALGVKAIVQVDGRPVGGGEPGPVASRLGTR